MNRRTLMQSLAAAATSVFASWRPEEPSERTTNDQRFKKGTPQRVALEMAVGLAIERLDGSLAGQRAAATIAGNPDAVSEYVASAILRIAAFCKTKDTNFDVSAFDQFADYVRDNPDETMRIIAKSIAKDATFGG